MLYNKSSHYQPRAVIVSTSNNHILIAIKKIFIVLLQNIVYRKNIDKVKLHNC